MIINPSGLSCLTIYITYLTIFIYFFFLIKILDLFLYNTTGYKSHATHFPCYHTPFGRCLFLLPSMTQEKPRHAEPLYIQQSVYNTNTDILNMYNIIIKVAVQPREACCRTRAQNIVTILISNQLSRNLCIHFVAAAPSLLNRTERK